MSTAKITGLAILAGLLASCSSPENGPNVEAESAAPVVVDLRVRENPESEYVSMSEFTVPEDHEIGDGMMPYEGIGWENALVGYRMYLDGRLVSDIFGKQVREPVLAQINEYGSYHELAPWGMDVLKVGSSLGIGGIGIMRQGEPAQFGSVPSLSATIGANGGDTGAFTITAGGIEGAGAAAGGFIAEYSIGEASPLTLVSVNAEGNLPLATGIVMHDGAEVLQSDEDRSEWRYVATWGDTQSENKDGLGMALFYRADQADYGGLANSTHYVAFNGPQFQYGFLAAWERDPMGIDSKEAFEALLAAELEALNGATE
uniref:DUF4861 family protein n=1 Tax=uncultured Altererythrobacter sp. TaxID=500840 RepID=UPI00261BDE0E|nr:DUF4861 family protein [uncultured Altererythrobacter sp.]